MRVLGLDLGTRRIGTAVSDIEGSIAFPHGVIERRDTRVDLEAVSSLIREQGVERVVVGLPIHMDGRSGPEARAARAFAKALATQSGLKVEVLDERWTTVEAERALRAGYSGRGRSKKREKIRRERVDSLAAALILRTYLERVASDATRGAE